MVIGKRRGFASIIGIGFALLLNANVVFAWNSVGHGVVATIAYEQLSPTEKKQLQTWIEPLHHYYPAVANVNALAAWPDWLKDEGVTAFNGWHYVNKPYGLHHYPVEGFTSPSTSHDEPNVIWAITHSEAVLVSQKSNPLIKSEFLGFLIHCVGDIHQPFHAINGYSAAYPQGDGGGNAIKVRAMDHQWHSLHSVWDSGFGLFSDQWGPASSQQVNNLAKKFMAQFPPTYFGKRIRVLDPNEWADESYELAVNFGYHTRKVLSHSYVTKGRKIVMEQVTLAGYRLARLLKNIIAIQQE